MNGHFVLIHDFKTDINAYLQANPEIGVADIDALLADGRSHADILPSLQASAGMTEESETTYLEELAQRRVVRRALLALMNTHNLDALAYPTIRQVAAPIGEEQLGTNCRLSANSGLPAISVPAGFAGGMPVGLELLAESWSEPKLLNLAYTIEQLFAQRQPPAATP
jgi:Asp-tRNA(Asn)/Glu-tRNA(Gln) amidotransferase A subunit family amidase